MLIKFADQYFENPSLETGLSSLHGVHENFAKVKEIIDQKLSKPKLGIIEDLFEELLKEGCSDYVEFVKAQLEELNSKFINLTKFFVDECKLRILDKVAFAKFCEESIEQGYWYYISFLRSALDAVVFEDRSGAVAVSSGGGGASAAAGGGASGFGIVFPRAVVAEAPAVSCQLSPLRGALRGAGVPCGGSAFVGAASKAPSPGVSLALPSAPFTGVGVPCGGSAFTRVYSRSVAEEPVARRKRQESFSISGKVEEEGPCSPVDVLDLEEEKSKKEAEEGKKNKRGAARPGTLEDSIVGSGREGEREEERGKRRRGGEGKDQDQERGV
jgi:hypothetical protein